MDSAQMCVVSRVRSLDSIPPNAVVAPVIAALSPGGMSAHVRLTLEKIMRGSGENGRICAGLPRLSECVIQADVTTGIIFSMAWLYCSKSIELAIIWVA